MNAYCYADAVRDTFALASSQLGLLGLSPRLEFCWLQEYSLSRLSKLSTFSKLPTSFWLIPSDGDLLLPLFSSCDGFYGLCLPYFYLISFLSLATVSSLTWGLIENAEKHFASAAFGGLYTSIGLRFRSWLPLLLVLVWMFFLIPFEWALCQ